VLERAQRKAEALVEAGARCASYKCVRRRRLIRRAVCTYAAGLHLLALSAVGARRSLAKERGHRGRVQPVQIREPLEGKVAQGVASDEDEICRQPR